MTLETLRALSDWLVPIVCAVAGWLTSSALRSLRKKNEIESTYKTLYENIQDTLLELQEDNKKLYKAFGRLQRAIHQVNTCVHHSACPINRELQKSGGDTTDAQRSNRQRVPRQKTRNQDRGDPSEPGGSESDDEPA